jgi:anaerobic selenocysteine-containing dehydrogenase
MVELDYDQKIRTYCPSPCILSCGMFAYIKEERVVKIEPAAMAPAGDKHICSKGLSIIQSKIYHPDRLKYPLKRIG